MENVAQYSNSLVYPSSSTPGTRSHEDDNPVNASSAWLSGQRSASNSSTSSTQLSSIYSAVDRPPDHGDYASTSTSYGQVQPNDSYSNYSQPSNIRPEDDGNHSATIALSPQISGSIGPSRLTRRQTRAQSTLHLGLRRDRPPAPSNVQSDLHGADESSYYMSPGSAVSRPQTPASSSDPNRYQLPDRMSFTMGSGGIPLQSPRYLSTPVSASPYSPFPMYHQHSRSASSYSTSNPRSASPALSVASALTSISSATSAPNSQTFPAFPLPSPPGAVIPRAKQRKQRLFNVDRKAICIYHQDNPNARQEDIAARYGVERSTISKILKNKTKWMNVPEDEDMRVAKHRPSKFPEVEEALVEWLLQMKQQQQNTLLSDNLIRTKAKETARSLQIPDERFKASSGWVENFKHRHNIRKGVWQGHEKVLRASRGLAGAQEHRRGATDTVLSPLNPAFEGRSEVANGHDSEEHSTMADGDDDMESEDEPEVPHPLQSQSDTGPSLSQAPLGPTLPLPRMWALQTDHLTAPNTPLSSAPPGNAHEPIPHQSFVHQRHEERQPDPVAADMNLSALPNPVQQHLQVTDPQQGVQLTHPDPSSQYTEPAVVYQPAPPITAGDTIANIGEAEDAINKVIGFVDSRPNLLSQTQRDVLHEIKCTLFQLGSGVPFDRNWR